MIMIDRYIRVPYRWGLAWESNPPPGAEDLRGESLCRRSEGSVNRSGESSPPFRIERRNPLFLISFSFLSQALCSTPIAHWTCKVFQSHWNFSCQSSLLGPSLMFASAHSNQFPFCHPPNNHSLFYPSAALQYSIDRPVRAYRCAVLYTHISPQL